MNRFSNRVAIDDDSPVRIWSSQVLSKCRPRRSGRWQERLWRGLSLRDAEQVEVPRCCQRSRWWIAARWAARPEGTRRRQRRASSSSYFSPPGGDTLISGSARAAGGVDAVPGAWCAQVARWGRSGSNMERGGWRLIDWMMSNVMGHVCRWRKRKWTERRWMKMTRNQ